MLISIMLLALLIVSAIPVMAKPTKGQKTAVTLGMKRVGDFVDIEDPVYTGPITHQYIRVNYDATITFDDGSDDLVGTLVTERKVVVVPQKEGEKRIFTDHYVFTFPGEDEDTGFVGNGKVILDGVYVPEGGGLSWEKSMGYGLFHGTGDFEGQTLNVGHTWGAPGTTPSAWTGYWLKR